jgi:hypothetical protein
MARAEETSSGELMRKNEFLYRLQKLIKKSKFLHSILSPVVLRHRWRRQEKLNEKYLADGNWSQKIRSLKDTVSSERCFVIGNGPSLALEDLEKLMDEVTFCSNRIYGAFDKTKWRPTYYGVEDSTVLSGIAEELVIPVSECDMAFFSWQGRHCVPAELLSRGNVNLFFVRLYQYPRDRDIPEDASRCILAGATVTSVLIQLAAYMGFKKIYLLGVDSNYSALPFSPGSDEKNYSKVIQKWEPPQHVQKHPERYGGFNKSMETEFYRQLSLSLEKTECTIINCTRGGALEAFERKTLEEILGQ